MNTPHINSPFRLSVKPQQDPDYLAFLRTQPCCVTGSWRGVESAHFGPRGRGQRADDRQALPLTRQLHRQHHALGTAKFVELHKLDLNALILDHNSLYESQLKRPRRQPITRVRLKPADLMRDAG